MHNHAELMLIAETSDSTEDSSGPPPASSLDAHREEAEAEQQAAESQAEAVTANANALMQRLISSTTEAEAELALNSLKAWLRTAQDICRKLNSAISRQSSDRTLGRFFGQEVIATAVWSTAHGCGLHV